MAAWCRRLRGTVAGVLLGTLLCAVSLVTGCERAPAPVQITGSTMGTQYSVTLAGAPGRQAALLDDDLAELLISLNRIFSTYEADSELSRLNRNVSLEWIGVSEPLFVVLRAAVEVAEASRGAFDVTVGPLVNLWGFGPEGKSRQIPEGGDVARELNRVGMDKFSLRADPYAVRKRVPDVYIDLSAIAKGYAVDRLAEFLEQRGLNDYLVDIGGELRAAGRNSEGRKWRIGIEDPRTGGRDIMRALPLSGRAMATSGNYRNFFEIDGVRYGHTIDPRTGAPARHTLAAVTVVHDSTMIADAWATAFMSLGLEAGRRIAEERSLAVQFVIRTEQRSEIVMSAAFESLAGAR